MRERDRRPGQGDITGPTRGDFTDWDNPEDDLQEEPEDDWEEREDAPEGYYDDEEGDEEFELSPEDPDYDLSEAAGYAGYESRRRAGIPDWLVVALALLLIFSILAPVVLQLR